MTVLQYKSPEEVWKALAGVKPGQDRTDILAMPSNRNLILNSGSFVVFSTGNVDNTGKTLRDKLSPIKVLQTQRLALKTGDDDGKGTFGGLSERTNLDQHLMANITIAMSELEGKKLDDVSESVFRQQLVKLVELKDDLKLDDEGKIVRISDLKEIARVSAAREAMEEALEIISGDDIHKKLRIKKESLRYIFSTAALMPIPVARVKDDNYVINIWDGNIDNPAFAVTPFGHLVHLKEDDFNDIINPGKKAMAEGHQAIEQDPSRESLIGREILGLEDVPLFDALKQWGKLNEDGSRNLSHDYRYPHEWMGVFRKAQLALELTQGPSGLGYREIIMTSLIEEVQNSIIDDAEANGTKPFNINLIGALTEMNGGKLTDSIQINAFEHDFDFDTGAFFNMHKAAENVMRKRGYEPTSPYTPLQTFLPVAGKAPEIMP